MYNEAALTRKDNIYAIHMQTKHVYPECIVSRFG